MNILGSLLDLDHMYAMLISSLLFSLNGWKAFASNIYFVSCSVNVCPVCFFTNLTSLLFYSALNSFMKLFILFWAALHILGNSFSLLLTILSNLFSINLCNSVGLIDYIPSIKFPSSSFKPSFWNLSCLSWCSFFSWYLSLLFFLYGSIYQYYYILLLTSIYLKTTPFQLG